MPDVKEYFREADIWDESYEGKGGKDLLTRIANRYFRKKLLNERLNGVLKIAEPVQGCSVLDLGCGSGRLCIELYRRGAIQVIGIDYNEEMLELANTKLQAAKQQGKLKFEVNEIKKYSISADIAIIIGVVSYYEDIEDILKNVIANNHRIIIFQYLPKISSTITYSLIIKLSLLWARIKKLKVYKHSKSQTDRYMGKHGYTLKDSYEDGNGLIVRYELLQ